MVYTNDYNGIVLSEMGVFDNIWELFWYNFSIWYNVTPRIKELFYDQMK